MENTTEAQAIATLIQKPFIDNFFEKPILFTPNGAGDWAWSIEESLLSAPARKTGNLTAHDVDSFIALLKRYGSLATMNVYLDVDYAKNHIKAIAIFNDHGDGHNLANPGWRDFRSTYQPRFSEEWKRWTGSNKQPMDQVKFAYFLEENVSDIAPPGDSKLPTGAEILTFVTALTETRKVKYGSGVNLQNGMVQIEFIEEGDNGTKGKLDFHKEFAIGIRPFFNGDGYQIKAHLRYRIDRNSGQISFWYDLQRHDKALEDASRAVIERIQRDAGATIIFGTPE